MKFKIVISVISTVSMFGLCGAWQKIYDDTSSETALIMSAIFFVGAFLSAQIWVNKS